MILHGEKRQVGFPSCPCVWGQLYIRLSHSLTADPDGDFGAPGAPGGCTCDRANKEGSPLPWGSRRWLCLYAMASPKPPRWNRVFTRCLSCWADLLALMCLGNAEASSEFIFSCRKGNITLLSTPCYYSFRTMQLTYCYFRGIPKILQLWALNASLQHPCLGNTAAVHLLYPIYLTAIIQLLMPDHSPRSSVSCWCLQCSRFWLVHIWDTHSKACTNSYWPKS